MSNATWPKPQDAMRLAQPARHSALGTTSNTLDADQFAGYLLLRELADNTVRSYLCLFQRWVDFAHAHHRNPFRPDPIVVREWVRSMEGSRSIIGQARATIKHLCAMLEVEDVSGVIPLPRKPRARSTRALPAAQARQLAIAADTAGLPGLAVLVGLYTAARRSEIASLAWDRVDFEHDTVTLDRTKVRDRHTVPLHPALRARLEQRHVPGDLWVFGGRHGGHVAPAVIWQWVREVGEVAGVGRVTTHQLRHTAITELNDATRDLRAAQDFAGHVSPTVTALYTRVGDLRAVEAVATLDFLSGA